MDFIYNSTGSFNTFDSFGRFLRTNIQVSNCIFVSEIVVQGCEASFQDLSAGTKKKKKKKKRKKGRKSGFSGSLAAPQATAPPAPPPAVEDVPELDPEEVAPEDEVPGEETTDPGAGEGIDPEGEGAGPEGDAGAEARKLSDAERARLRAAGIDPRALEPMSLEDAGLLLEFLLGATP
jgi:hypothetical protein